MDKYEYKVRSEEIKELIAQKEYFQAAEIADTIDWRRVKSVMMLCTISDLYKINRRYEDSRDLLLLAYDRHPSGRNIVYALCELAIKMGEIPQAWEYCKEYVQIAPKDPGRYILQYKLYEAEEVNLEERIAVLEELKKRDYREKWAYELAYLYHRIGLASKCVDECDEMIVWFGDGKYVIKAMELKRLHQPLTPEQQRKYDSYFAVEENDEEITEEEPVEESEAVTTTTWSGEEVVSVESVEDIEAAATKRIPVEEINIQVKTMDPGQCNTINLQEEVAAGLRELLEGEVQAKESVQAVATPMMETGAVEEAVVEAIVEGSEEVVESLSEEVQETVESVIEETQETVVEEMQEVLEASAEETQEVPVDENVDKTASIVMEQLRQESKAEPSEEMAKVLSMEADGQISFVVPESEKVEKQITGQISIEDVMAEWERIQKVIEEENMEKLRKRVKADTGPIFTKFEASLRDDLLEQLENGRDPRSVIAEAEGKTLDEDEIPVPPSLLEDEAEEEENFVEDYEEISVEEAQEVVQEYTEEAIEEPVEEEYTEEAIEEPVEEEYTEEVFEEPVEEEYTEEVIEELAEEEYTEEAIEESAEEEYAEEAINYETISIATDEVEAAIQQEATPVRNLTREEKDLFGPYIQGRSSREQLVHAIDNISMAPYTGNVIITGVEGMDTLGLAKSIVREIQLTDSNFSGKTAKISGEFLNKRDVDTVLEGLGNGALIIQRATSMDVKTTKNLNRALQQENRGLVVILEGTKKAMNAFLAKNKDLHACFTARIDMEALSDAALVAFGKKYAREKEYSIDEFGVLALHQIITDRQTIDHAVTIMEVKEIMDDAMENADRKSFGHFFDVLMGKRYDDEDMIIIREKDFM